MNTGNGRSFFALLLSLAALVALSFGLPAHASGSTYFVNNLSGSNCSDSGAHTINQPWCTFAPINKIGRFSPGDQILLARGGAWNQEMTLTGTGTSTEPITLSSYGAGASPRILRNQSSNDICIALTDPSYWNISNLEVGQASVGILLHYSQLFNHGISIDNIYAHDNKGIWGGYSTEFPVSHKEKDPFAASLNINLSSGILFNIASSLVFTSSQYVLKGVSISNIRGNSNVDSVAFDAETNTIDNQDGHNAFQNVILNGLFLSSDNGHAARIYQHARLGCSDSLRLLGMMNVTLLNSVLYDEAACHTSTGTAAIILGRVSHVTFVNNIIFGVPASKSPDETGIDFEWSESQVSLHANLFAGHAGAGIEILNIHKGDHTSELDFRDNTFIGNARNRHPGAASIWEACKGRGYATPTGSIKNNLYSESNGRFFAGRNIGSIVNTNNLSLSSAANYAAEQFSSVQGNNQWRYMFEPSDSTWTNMPRYSPADYNGAWEVSPAQYVSAFNLAPASCTGSCNTGGVARVWTAPHGGTISIRGRVLKSDTGGGDGVYAVINLVSERNVTRIWPASSGKQRIAGTDQEGYVTDLNGVSVASGDQIRFEVSAAGDNSYDTVSWTPSVGYTTPQIARCANADSNQAGETSTQAGASPLARNCRN